jgi:D-glycero-alpha-D-manno-heptose-7-phosphate kinase
MSGIRLSYEADLPARSGLGTSSSFAVGMINAFHAVKGSRADKRRLADEAIHLERVLCGEAGGEQDQIAVAFGGLNRIDFSAGGYSVRPLIMPKERKLSLSGSLMLFFTGLSRFSASIQEGVAQSLGGKSEILGEMKSLVDMAEKILASKGSLDEFGRLLDYAWKLKRGMSAGVSTPRVDEAYAKALEAGALGGKLLGAGGGGFLLFYVPRERQDSVAEALGDMLRVPFEFEGGGASVLYYDAEDWSESQFREPGEHSGQRLISSSV